MNEETYLKAKTIMDEVDGLRKLKKFPLPSECYSISFCASSHSVSANMTDIGSDGMERLIRCFTDIVDELIQSKLKRLEEI